MSKVYLNPEKIFKYFGVLALVFGVVSCASSQSTAATSGETDGVYYSPSKDGQVTNISSESNAYDIQVGSPYFDANGNGAEDFYYDEQQTAQSSDTAQNVNIYTGGSNVYVTSGATADWGRYDGLDITVNNFGGWYDPWWGWGYNSWGWGWGSRWGMGWGGWYNSWNWGWGGGWGWSSPYYGWGGWYGYNPYWGNPYWGWGGGYYGNGYYYRGTAVNPGVRPGSYLAHGTPYRNSSSLRSNNNSFRTDNSRPVREGNSTIRNSNIRSEGTNSVRPVRETNVRENPTASNIRSNNNGTAPVRQTNNGPVDIRTNQNNSGNVIRPVRQTAPDNVRPNTPIRTDNNIRTNNSNIRYNENTRSNNSNIRTNSNSNIRSNSNSGSNMRSSSSSPSMRSGSSSGGMRSSGSSSGGMRSGGRR